MAVITLSFTNPAPLPAGGFIVRYREKGTTLYNTLSPNPTSSPVQITVPDGKNWEGTIQSKCNVSSLSAEIPWAINQAVSTTPRLIISLTNNDPNVPIEVRWGNNGGSPSNLLYSGLYTSNPIDIPLVGGQPANNAIVQLNTSGKYIIQSATANSVSASGTGDQSVSWTGVTGNNIILNFLVQALPNEKWQNTQQYSVGPVAYKLPDGTQVTNAPVSAGQILCVQANSMQDSSGILVKIGTC